MERLKRDHTRQLIAGALVVAALVVLTIGYGNIRDEIQVAAQMPYVLTGGIGALILTGLPFAVLGLVLAIGVALLALVFALSVVLGPILLIALVIVLASRRRHAPRRRPTHFRPQY